MTHRSESLGFIEVPPTMADETKPVSTGLYRFLADDGLHMGDQFGRVLVNWQDDAGLSTLDPPTGGYNRIISFGPLRLTVDPDGIAYPIRVRIAGAADATKSGVSQCSFLIMVRPIGSAGSQVQSGSGRSATSVATALTAPFIQILSSYILTLDERETGQCLAEDQSTDDGSAAVSVPVYKAYIDVFSKNVTSDGSGVLWAVYAAEYVGL